MYCATTAHMCQHAELIASAGQQSSRGQPIGCAYSCTHQEDEGEIRGKLAGSAVCMNWVCTGSMLSGEGACFNPAATGAAACIPPLTCDTSVSKHWFWLCGHAQVCTRECVSTDRITPDFGVRDMDCVHVCRMLLGM